MSNEVTDVKQLPKETVAKFVNDAAEMETSSFTLKQTADETEKQAKALKNSAVWNLQKSREALENAQKKYEEAQNTLSSTKTNASSYNYAFSLRYDTDWKPFILLSLFLAPIIGFIMMNIYYLCCHTDLDTVIKTNPSQAVCADFSIFYILTCAILFLIIQIKNRIEKKQDNEYHTKKFETAISQAKRHADQCQTEYDNLVLANNKQTQASKQAAGTKSKKA